MSSNLPGNATLAYLGLSEKNPPDIITTSRDPKTSDNKNVKIGDFWYNKISKKFWMLVSLSSGIAVWDAITGVSPLGEIESLVPGSGSEVFPNVTRQVLMPNGNGIATVGTLNTLTTNMATPFVGTFGFEGGGIANGWTFTNTGAANVDVSIGCDTGNPALHFTRTGTQYTMANQVGGFVFYSNGSSLCDVDAGGTPAWNFFGNITMTSVGAGILNANTVRIGSAIPVDTTAALAIEKTSVGLPLYASVRNLDNTNIASSAICAMACGGSAGGNPFVTYNVPSVTSWSHGIKNSDSDSFYITSANTLEGFLVLKAETAGIITVPNAINAGPGTPIAIGSNSFPLQASASNSGNSVAIGINNNSNTANSHAQVTITVGGTSGGDPQIVLNGSTNNWSFGSDTSATDLFTIASGYVLGTTNRFTLTPAGIINMPGQVAFLGYLAASALNKTGTGTSYTLGTDALTEIYDQSSSFTTAGVFTAPVTGIYDLRSQITLTGTTIATSFLISIVVAGTSANTYTNTFTRAAAATDQSVSISVLALMTATDTATVTISASGEGGDTDDILGGATIGTYFCGTLAC